MFYYRAPLATSATRAVSRLRRVAFADTALLAFSRYAETFGKVGYVKSSGVIGAGLRRSAVTSPAATCRPVTCMIAKLDRIPLTVGP